MNIIILLFAPFIHVACWGWKIGTLVKRGQSARFWSEEFVGLGLPTIGDI